MYFVVKKCNLYKNKYVCLSASLNVCANVFYKREKRLKFIDTFLMPHNILFVFLFYLLLFSIKSKFSYSSCFVFFTFKINVLCCFLYLISLFSFSSVFSFFGKWKYNVPLNYCRKLITFAPVMQHVIFSLDFLKKTNWKQYKNQIKKNIFIKIKN